jgi:hypothetical protein
VLCHLPWPGLLALFGNMADRSSELVKLTQLFGNDGNAKGIISMGSPPLEEPVLVELSKFMRVSLKIAKLMQGNEELVQKMETSL